MSTARQNCIASYCKKRRLEEADDNGMVQCISCGKILPWNEADGGHYISRQVRALETEHNNVWPQCKHCNQMLYGNEKAYRVGLVKRVGESEVRRLELIADASRGSQDAYLKLSMQDRVKVSMKKFRNDYIEDKRAFDKESRELRRRIAS